jgi:hypothetical protein
MMRSGAATQSRDFARTEGELNDLGRAVIDRPPVE